MKHISLADLDAGEPREACSKNQSFENLLVNLLQMCALLETIKLFKASTIKYSITDFKDPIFYVYKNMNSMIIHVETSNVYKYPQQDMIYLAYVEKLPTSLMFSELQAA